MYESGQRALEELWSSKVWKFWTHTSSCVAVKSDHDPAMWGNAMCVTSMCNKTGQYWTALDRRMRNHLGTVVRIGVSNMLLADCSCTPGAAKHGDTPLFYVFGLFNRRLSINAKGWCAWETACVISVIYKHCCKTGWNGWKWLPGATGGSIFAYHICHVLISCSTTGGHKRVDACGRVACLVQQCLLLWVENAVILLPCSEKNTSAMFWRDIAVKVSS